MESSVIVNNVPVFPKAGKSTFSKGDFKASDDEEGKNIWEELASTHPHLAGELSGRFPAWVSSRKRRGSRDRVDSDSEGRSRQARDTFFNFPTEFRQYIPSEWGERFDSGDVEVEPQNSAQQTSKGPTKFERQQSSEKATQTEEGLTPNLNQHKLRNTVDFGQKTAAEIGQLDVEKARNQRSMSAPPDTRSSATTKSSTGTSMNNMGNPQPQQQPSHQQSDENMSQSSNKPPNVRHIPIFVEGRDEPVINAHKDTTTNFAESRPTPPKEQYFMEHEMPQSFHPTPHFSRAFGSPFKGFSNRNAGGFGPKLFNNQTNDQPQQKFKQQTQQHPQSQEQTSCPPQQQAHQPHPPQQQASYPPQAHAPPEPQTQRPTNQHDETDGSEDLQNVPQPPHHILNDPIEKIQSIQRDVLELMSQVETFKGTSKKDKEYIYLDEMLTRNLIKLDDIETEGKENIRLARREAIKCIQQCIAVLESQVDNKTAVEAQGKGTAKTEEENKQDSLVTKGAELKNTDSMEVDNNKAIANTVNATSQQMEVEANNTSSQ